MIIYGSNSTHLIESNPSEITCPHCETKGSTHFSLFSKYGHVFWIPFIPMGRVAVSECAHCQYTPLERHMTEEWKREVRNLKSQTRVPFWHFSGLAIVAIFALNAFYSGLIANQKEASYLDAPEVGDLYVYKENGNFSTMKIFHISSDTLYVQYNYYETNMRSGISEIDKDENYSGLGIPKLISEIRGMHDKGKIVQVKR